MSITALVAAKFEDESRSEGPAEDINDLFDERLSIRGPRVGIVRSPTVDGGLLPGGEIRGYLVR